MKIRDVLYIGDTLHDLAESLSYVPQDVAWDDDIATFTVNQHKYQATVRPASARERNAFVPFFDKVPCVGNVDF